MEFPVWLRLTRINEMRFQGDFSLDGESWIPGREGEDVLLPDTVPTGCFASMVRPYSSAIPFYALETDVCMEVNLEPGPFFIRSDANSSGDVDLSDADNPAALILHDPKTSVDSFRRK